MKRLLIPVLLSLCLIVGGATHVSAQNQGGAGGTGQPQGSAGGTGQVEGPAGPGSDTSGTLVNPLKVNSLKGLLDLVLSAAIELGSILLVLMLVWVGFLFVAARGNEEKIRSARTALMWTVIGGLILLGAKGIESVISSTVSTL